MKILCAGDGFGKGHIWKMWPQLLEEVLDNCKVDNVSQVGAGNEYIMNATIDACTKNKYDFVIVQWAQSDRLDIINSIILSISYLLHDITRRFISLV
jgi:hypothetical protein